MLNNLKNYALVLAAIITLSGCKKKSDNDTPSLPTAAFTYEFTATNFAPAQVRFHNSSTNATSYSWNYGDGGVSTAVEQSYIFNTAGDFNVTLTATNSDGSNTTTQTIHIANATIAKLTQINLTQFPVRDSAGNPWDAGSGPDIYFKLYQNDTANVAANYFGLIQPDVTATSVTITPTTPYSITNFNDIMYLAAFDQDAVQDSVIGKGVAPLVGFRMSDYTTTHPSTINIASTADSLKYTLLITWQ